LEVNPVWFDSMGAKSTCTKVVTRDTSLLIDPGAAAMQPSYPMSDEKRQSTGIVPGKGYRRRERTSIIS